MNKQILRALLLGAAAIAVSGTAIAQDGFYGGVAMRDGGTDAMGLTLGTLPLSWNRFVTPAGEDAVQRSLVFGGYRWSSDISVEAAFNAADKYALRPGATGGLSSVGMGLSDPSRTWNADVYTSWEFVHSLSLYGRLGYAQTDTRSLWAPTTVAADPRRKGDGVNYGVGLRYDLTHALGLRVEYARFGRFSGETISAGLLPDSDHVTVGVQFKF